MFELDDFVITAFGEVHTFKREAFDLGRRHESFLKIKPRDQAGLMKDFPDAFLGMMHPAALAKQCERLPRLDLMAGVTA